MTFRGRDFILGFFLYQLVCCYGLVVQFSVVQSLLLSFPTLSDSLLTLYGAYLVGVAFAAVGNFFLHSYYTWNRLGFSTFRNGKAPAGAV
jgi:putative flippase GtrA